MEKTGAFMAVTFITKSGSSYWSSYTTMAGILANFGPNSQDYARMAHVSHLMRYGCLLPLLDLLQQSPRMVLRTTMNLLDQEDVSL